MLKTTFRKIVLGISAVALPLGVISLTHAATPTQPASGPASTRAGRGAARGNTGPLAPATLPGKGLAEHDFLYAGESGSARKIFIIKGGKVVWSYDDPQGKGEISDATLLSNGNVVIAHQFAAKVINSEKKVLWNYDVPTGCEIHTIQAIGKEHVLFVQNGPKPILRVVNIVTNETKKEFPLPVQNANNTHGQFRHARLTADGTVLVAHMDMGKLSEYNTDGKEVWTYAIPGIWGVEPLKNGNILITASSGSREINKKGDVIWSFVRADLPEYRSLSLQLAWRLPNGNTLIDSWSSGTIDPNNAPIQALEMTPEKKVVWALREWKDPNLGPATTIQILDVPTVPEDVHFGDIK